MQVPIGCFSVFGQQEKQQQVHVGTPLVCGEALFQSLMAEAKFASARFKQCECMLSSPLASSSRPAFPSISTCHITIYVLSRSHGVEEACNITLDIGIPLHLFLMSNEKELTNPLTSS
jgi:hypothetical protein